MTKTKKSKTKTEQIKLERKKCDICGETPKDDTAFYYGAVYCCSLHCVGVNLLQRGLLKTVELIV